MHRADLKRFMCTTAAARLGTLRTQPYAQLAKLPAYSGEDINDAKAQLSTYRDDIGSGRLRIVVQVIVPGWLGFSSFVRAWGFTVDPDGSVAALNEEALWDFT
jgi:hypothetical protein